MFFNALLANNNLSVVSTSCTSIAVQLQNTEAIAGIQFTINCSSNFILSDPKRGDRVSDLSWMMDTYRPNDSTINVLFINMKNVLLDAGTGSILQLTLTSDGKVQESNIMLTNVIVTNT